jgi:hypothetical protein
MKLARARVCACVYVCVCVCVCACVCHAHKSTMRTTIFSTREHYACEGVGRKATAGRKGNSLRSIRLSASTERHHVTASTARAALACPHQAVSFST